MRFFTPVEMSLMFARMEKTEWNIMMWTVTVFGFRTLLRMCNLVPTPGAPDSSSHVLSRGDIELIFLYVW